MSECIRRLERYSDDVQGQIEIRHEPVDIKGPRPYQFKFKQLDDSISYEELKDSEFPIDTFKDEELTWTPFVGDLDIDLEKGPDRKSLSHRLTSSLNVASLLRLYFIT